MPRGSQWGIWDLHIHTPESFHWSGPRFADMDPDTADAAVAGLVQRLNDAEPAVFGTQDYWTFAGYTRIKEAIARLGLELRKTLLPGVELRVASPSKFRLNLHVLFSDAVERERLEEFTSNLNILGDFGAPNRPNLAAFGDSLGVDVWRKHGVAEAGRGGRSGNSWRLGVQTAVVTVESLQKALGRFRQDEFLVIQPFDTNDGLSRLKWAEHPAEAQFFMRMADVFESRKQANVDLFLGVSLPVNEGEEGYREVRMDPPLLVPPKAHVRVLVRLEDVGFAWRGEVEVGFRYDLRGGVGKRLRVPALSIFV